MSRSICPLVLVCLLGCGSAAPPAASTASQRSTAPQSWDALAQRFIDESFAEDPGFAVSQGRHEQDGKIADLSKAGLAASIARLKRTRDEVLAFDTSSLDEGRKFEREYVLAQIDSSLFWSERVRRHEKSPLVYSAAIDPSVYLTRDYAPLAQRLVAYIAHAREIPRVLSSMKENLRSPMPRTFVDVGIQVFAGLGPYLAKDVLDIFAQVDDVELQRELRAVTGPAVSAIKDATAWLEAQKASADEAFALGPDLFREMLWATERVDTPLEVLESVGQKDLEENLQKLRGACDKLASGKSLTECAALVTDEKPQAGPVVGAREQLDLLKRFIAERDLVTIPGNEEARVEEAPPYNRWNQAYIEIPGPFEVGMPSIYYIAPPDPAWSPADRLAYLPGEADLLFISVHEVWPGHFLQFLHANRAERMFGRVYVGYAFAEGWAHYTEEMMWDAGLSEGDPKVHVGQLLNALLRNARFLSAIGLHTRGMTVAESETLFRERGLQDAGNAKQQAARGTFDPAYLNYTLGKLMIRKLRADWTSTRGGRAAWRAFHDRLLSYGGPPLPLLRKAMLGDESSVL